LINVHQTSDRLLASQVPLGVSWSADGKRLAFVAGEPSSESLWVVNADGSGLHQISGVHPYSTPTWSPDSRWLAFAISRDQKSTIVIARPDGTGMRAIARSAGAEIHWSPNGRWIAYEGRALPTRVRVIHPNGSDGHAVAVGLSPSWAPDSRRLVFNTGSPRKTFAIATVSGTRLYAFGKVDAGPAYWSPRGARIVYVEGGLIGRRDQLYAAGAQGRRARQLTHDRPVAYEDPIEDVRWVTRGRYVGRLLYYSRALCDSTP
jgi:TolB protein